MSLAFKAHPYRWPIIGWMEDIRRIAPAELRAFYDTYYRPNNAILVVVGDVAAAEILGRVRELFGGIARGPDPPPVAAIEPPQIDERRLVVKKAGRPAPDRERRLARAESSAPRTRRRSICCRPSCPRDGRRASTGS